ncbi:DUF3276 family protein [Candidatus Roizmanbacteria bacterium]|nr:DUF3276 family protein [Candidatus Roizmanbacteria bacterium]
MDQPQATTTNAAKTLKFGKRTYFFDLKTASNGSVFLKITESLFIGEGQDRRRNSLTLFKNDIDQFIEMVNSLKDELKDSGQKPTVKVT